MAPYQSRMVAERDELRDKTDALAGFVTTTDCAALEVAEQVRLARQLDYMRGYLAVLGERITAFT